jgi:hypothetical protein
VHRLPNSNTAPGIRMSFDAAIHEYLIPVFIKGPGMTCAIAGGFNADAVFI